MRNRCAIASSLAPLLTLATFAALAVIGCGDSAAPNAGAPEPSNDGGAGPTHDANAPASDGAADDAPSAVPDAAPPGDAAAPPEFWDTSNIPPAKNVMTFKFLNRTNGKFKDSEVFWSFKNGTVSETHSIAEAPTYDMPANNSGRMYFYICAAGAPTNCTGDPTKSKYFDFIEHTI